MEDIFVVSDNICSPVGLTTAQNFDNLKNGIGGVKMHQNALAHQPYYASLFNEDVLDKSSRYTRFEQLLINSITDALKDTNISVRDEKTLLIISSTKGNISLLEENNSPELKERIALSASAQLVAGHFGFVNKPLVISNACISGIMAILTGMRLLRSGKFENAVIAGADVISKFVLSGFQSFQAISSQPCRPFDKDRDGISLGEGAATMILSKKPLSGQNIKVMGGSVSNDANHISAPSRTGAELAHAIDVSLKMAGLCAKDIGLISAHGTATIYNDEMEAKAISLSGLQSVPLNSLKGFYGHTLGAAGLIESIIAIQSLKESLMIGTPGFSELGVSSEINVCKRTSAGKFDHCIKTASGFGGCNAAIVFGKQ